MFWVWQIVIYIAATLASYYLTPRSKPTLPRPGALSDLQLPTIDEGLPVPVVRGTCLLRAPALVWAGDFSTLPFADHDVVMGYHYYFAGDFVLCHGPLDELVELRFDDRVFRGITGSGINDTQYLMLQDGASKVQVHFAAQPGCVMDDLAAFATADIQSVVPSFGRVVFGYRGLPAARATLILSTTVGSAEPFEMTLDLGYLPGDPDLSDCTGTELADALTRRMAAWEIAVGDNGLHGVWSYSATTGKFALALSNPSGLVTRFAIDPASTILPYLGIDHWDGDVWESTSFPANLTAEHRTDRDCFFFDFPPGVEVLWTDEITNCHELFGTLGPQTGSPTPDFVSSHVCELPRRLESYDPTSDPGFWTPGWKPPGGAVWINSYPDYVLVEMNAPDLYGGSGAGGGGGVWGDIYVYRGTQTQMADPFLVAKMIGPVSAYPGIVHMLLHPFCWGDSTSIRPIAAVVRVTPNPLGLTEQRHLIGVDYNPMSLLWELCTDPLWGPGIAPEMLDRDAFVEACNVLAGERLGVSMVFDDQSEAADLASEVCRHANALPYINPITGLFSFKLVRPDYDPDALPEIDESMLSNVRFTRPSWGKTKNAVRAHFTDRAHNFMEGTAIVEDQASIEAQGGRKETQDLTFRGFSTVDTATAAAGRELAPVCYPFAVLEADCDRHAWQQHPAGVFAFTSARLGISRMPMRVASLSGGTLEHGTISLQAVEDVFGLPWTVYGTPQ